MSTKPLVSIITGNSISGSACIDEIFQKFADKLNVRASFRSQEKAQPFKDKYPNLQIVTGCDAYKPETLVSTFEGADSALIVTPHDPAKSFDDDATLTANMINQAVACNVKYIVLVASFTASYREQMPIIAGRFWPSEELLEKLSKEKNIKYTVLRGGNFMENLLPGLKKSIKAQSAVNLPAVFSPYVDTKDIGKSAAVCLAANGEGHHGKYYEMNGPEILGGEDVAKILTKVFGN